MIIISASIDLNKVIKTKIVNGKNGSKYYNLDIIVGDEKNKYDQDTSICDRQTKEERERKEKRNYIGNGKVVYRKELSVQENLRQDDSIPF